MQDKLDKARSRFVTKQLQIDADAGEELELKYGKEQIIVEIAIQKAALTLAKAQLKRWQLNLDIAKQAVVTSKPHGVSAAISQSAPLS